MLQAPMYARTHARTHTHTHTHTRSHKHTVYMFTDGKKKNDSRTTEVSGIQRLQILRAFGIHVFRKEKCRFSVHLCAQRGIWALLQGASKYNLNI